MVKTSFGALALAALPSALAFRNTSPFFLFSTANLNLPNADAAIAESSQVTSDVFAAVKDCPTKSFVIIEQEGVSAADYAGGHSSPQLAQYMSGKDEDVKTRYAVPDVVGHVNAKALVQHIKSKCGADAVRSRDVFEPPVAAVAERRRYLQRMDGLLGDYVYQAAEPHDFTIIYITSPVEESVAKAQQQDSPPYEMENAFGNFDQLELKRDLSSHVKRANTTSEGGLFERYQYFTPGIFMGMAAALPLFLILVVGIRALTSLEVSYFAFSKEMGPNAQKPGKQ